METRRIADEKRRKKEKVPQGNNRCVLVRSLTNGWTRRQSNGQTIYQNSPNVYTSNSQFFLLKSETVTDGCEVPTDRQKHLIKTSHPIKVEHSASRRANGTD